MKCLYWAALITNSLAPLGNRLLVSMATLAEKKGGGRQEGLGACSYLNLNLTAHPFRRSYDCVQAGVKEQRILFYVNIPQTLNITPKKKNVRVLKAAKCAFDATTGGIFHGKKWDTLF